MCVDWIYSLFIYFIERFYIYLMLLFYFINKCNLLYLYCFPFWLKYCVKKQLFYLRFFPLFFFFFKLLLLRKRLYFAIVFFFFKYCNLFLFSRWLGRFIFFFNYRNIILIKHLCISIFSIWALLNDSVL